MLIIRTGRIPGRIPNRILRRIPLCVPTYQQIRSDLTVEPTDSVGSAGTPDITFSYGPCSYSRRA